MLPQQQAQVDLGGAYPHRVHSPTFLGWSEVTQEAVFLLLDTGYSGGCGFEDSSNVARFKGNVNDPAVRLGPITALQPLPQSVRHGEFLNQPNIILGNLARAIPLSVNTAHVNGVTASYLLGPRQDGQYGQRLIAFWSAQAVPQCTVELSATEEEDKPGREQMTSIFGHPVTFYTTPLTLLSPGSQGIPARAVNEIALKVVLVDRIPRAVAQIPGGRQFSCVWDTGAAYNVVRREVAEAYNLPKEYHDRIVLPQLDFPEAHPPLSLRNVPAVVDNSFGFADQIILGCLVLDRFRTVILDFGANVDEEEPCLRVLGASGVIRLIP